MKTSTLITLSSMLLALGAQAQDGSSSYEFDQVWRLVKANSPELRAASEEAAGAKIGGDRAGRHWYPRLYIEGRAFSTNDPGQSLFSTLGQRKIQASDFSPSALNEPAARLYARGTVGLDMPLFEGGMKAAMASAANSVAVAVAHDWDATTRGQYAATATAYASLLTLIEQQTQLESLKNSVAQTLARYSVGAKSNPVGYSGLLGLRGLGNRLDGLLTENAARRAAISERLRLMARDLPAQWSPGKGRARDFLAQALPASADTGTDAPPPAVLAARAAAEAQSQSKNAERAKFLPRVGLFAEGYAYNGSRDTATSYSSGAYLQWDLFSAPNFGSMAQAGHGAAAAEARADAAELRARAARAEAQSSIAALERNLSLMDESAQILHEQTNTARELFRNGSINALQLVEVLARRADLLVSRTDAEIKLSESRASALMNSGVTYGK